MLIREQKYLKFYSTWKQSPFTVLARWLKHISSLQILCLKKAAKAEQVLKRKTTEVSAYLQGALTLLQAD